MQTGLPGVGIGMIPHDEHVDCTVPCPADPVQEQVRATNQQLQGRWFAEEGGARVELFRDREDCEASPHPSEARLSAVCEEIQGR
jgi:hypothetical protein